MNNKKSYELSKLLNSEMWRIENEKLYYKKEEVRQACFNLPKKLESKLESFKIEFRDNELESNSEKYLRSKILQFSEKLEELEKYMYSSIKTFKNIDSIGHHPTREEVEKHFKYLSDIGFDILEYLIECQINTCKDTIDYINKSIVNTPLKPKTEKEIVINTKLSEEEKENMDFLRNFPKMKFNTSAKKVVIIFWCLQNAGILDFGEQNDFCSFIEKFCKSQLKGEYKDIKDVAIILSKLRNEIPSKHEKKLFPYNKLKTEIFSKVGIEVNDLKDKLEYILNTLNMPATFDEDRLKK